MSALPMQPSNTRIAYVFGSKFLNEIRHMPKFGERSLLVHSLIKAYNLLRHMDVIEPKTATKDELKNFHSEDFIEFLNQASEDAVVDDYGIGYDCPVFENMFDIVCAGAGATLCAARALTSEQFRVAINWTGGWHHAKRDEASGFCYVNDIVLGILWLRKKYEKVLYIDLDLHHGDGVEEAFSHSTKVFCFSVHKYAAGFFPCSGSWQDVGSGKGKFYTMNVPLHDGIQDEAYTQLVLRLLSEVRQMFHPDAVVMQCGADTLVGDPFGCFNLTPRAQGVCLKAVVNWKLPLLVLGGGGYNNANTARCWTYLTSIICRVELNEDIPDHENILEYGPGYELHLTPGNRSDSNTSEYLDTITKSLLTQLSHIR